MRGKTGGGFKARCDSRALRKSRYSKRKHVWAPKRKGRPKCAISLDPFWGGGKKGGEQTTPGLKKMG